MYGTGELQEWQFDIAVKGDVATTLRLKRRNDRELMAIREGRKQETGYA